jgi:G:T/U-mismatch repair DNA glycosylase
MIMQHPWLDKYPISKNSKYLIIGTHPPMPYCGKLEFYYGNMNEFWRFLDQVYPGNLLYKNRCPELGDILNFLNKAQICITDLVKETNGDSFSTDQKMVWTKLNDSLKVSLLNSSIETIYFTSGIGQNSSLSLFKKWLKINDFCDVKIPDIKLWRENGLAIKLGNKSIQLEYLFSPSPSARRSKDKIGEFLKWKEHNKNESFDEFRIDWYKQKLPKL